MDIERYKDIVGITEFLRYFPNTAWYYFHDMQEFRWYRNYDYEEWCDRFCIELIMSDVEQKDVICFNFVNVSGCSNCEFSGWISGFEIVNLKQTYTSSEKHYEILDYEDEQIHFYCDDIEVKVLRVNGENIMK